MIPHNFTKMRVWVVTGGTTLFAKNIVCKGEVFVLNDVGVGVMFDIVVGETWQILLFNVEHEHCQLG